MDPTLQSFTTLEHQYYTQTIDLQTYVSSVWNLIDTLLHDVCLHHLESMRRTSPKKTPTNRPYRPSLLYFTDRSECRSTLSPSFLLQTYVCFPPLHPNLPIWCSPPLSVKHLTNLSLMRSTPIPLLILPCGLWVRQRLTPLGSESSSEFSKSLNDCRTSIGHHKRGHPTSPWTRTSL